VRPSNGNNTNQTKDLVNKKRLVVRDSCRRIGLWSGFLNRRSEVRVLSGPPITISDSFISMT
jgi:hypothetical protein